MFCNKPINSPAICLVAERYCAPDGSGDIYFQINLFDILKRQFPTLSIMLHPLTSYEADSFRTIDRTIKLMPLDKVATVASQSPTLIIHGPVPTASLPDIKGKYILWRIHEYNSVHSTDKKEDQPR